MTDRNEVEFQDSSTLPTAFDQSVYGLIYGGLLKSMERRMNTESTVAEIIKSAVLKSKTH